MEDEWIPAKQSSLLILSLPHLLSDSSDAQPIHYYSDSLHLDGKRFYGFYNKYVSKFCISQFPLLNFDCFFLDSVHSLAECQWRFSRLILLNSRPLISQRISVFLLFHQIIRWFEANALQAAVAERSQGEQSNSEITSKQFQSLFPGILSLIFCTAIRDELRRGLTFRENTIVSEIRSP